MSEAEPNPNAKPSRLQLVREKGRAATPALPKRGAQLLDIELLVEDPANERKTFRNMDGLIETVKTMGVIEPLTVTPADGGGYMVVTGHRRLRAAKAAGLNQVRVIIAEPSEAQVRRRRSIVSNVQREDVPPVEMAEALQAILEEDPNVGSQRELAQLIGKRESWISDMLRILTLPPELQQELRTSETAVPYDAVMRISRVDDQRLQRRLVRDVLDGKSNRDIRGKIEKAKQERAGQDGGRTEKAGPAAKPDPAPKASTEPYTIEVSSASVAVTFTGGNAPSKAAAIQALREALQTLEQR